MDYIYDFETLGQDRKTAPLVTFAGVAFNTDSFLTKKTHYSYDDLYGAVKFLKLSIEDQLKYGRKIEKGTMEWWKQKPIHIQKSQLASLPDDLTVTQFCKEITDQFYFSDYKNVWCRGASFDHVLMDSIFRDIEIDRPFPFWKERDTRTAVEVLTLGTKIKNTFMPNGINKNDLDLHDPRVDIVIDVLRLQELYYIHYGQDEE